MSRRKGHGLCARSDTREIAERSERARKGCESLRGRKTERENKNGLRLTRGALCTVHSRGWRVAVKSECRSRGLVAFETLLPSKEKRVAHGTHLVSRLQGRSTRDGKGMDAEGCGGCSEGMADGKTGWMEAMAKLLLAILEAVRCLPARPLALSRQTTRPRMPWLTTRGSREAC